MEWSSVAMLVKVMFLFSLLFVLLPALAVRPDRDRHGLFLDRLFIPLIHSTVFIMIAVHLLVVVKLFETFSLILVCLAALIYCIRRQGRKRLGDPGTRALSELFDLSESWAEFRRKLADYGRHLQETAKSGAAAFLRTMRTKPFIIGCILLTLGIAFYMRARHTLVHYYFGASDPYVHLKWGKFLQKNVLYVDGVYPYGFEAMLAALSRFFLIDMYELIRFIGPLTALLIFLSIGYAVLKITGNLYAMFIAMFAYAFCSLLPESYSAIWRQVSALSMEYGMIFLLPGIVFWLLFIRSKNRAYLLLAAECLFLCVIIHPFAAAVQGVSIAIVGAVRFGRLWREKLLSGALLYFGIAGVLGVAPLGIALAVGVPFPGSEYVEGTITTETGTGQTFLQAAFGWMSRADVIAAGAILLLTAAMLVLYVRIRRSLSGPAADLPAILAVCCVFFVLYRSNEFGIPLLVPLDRLGLFSSVLFAYLLGTLVYAVSRLFEFRMRRAYVSALLSLGLAAGILLTGHTLKTPVGDRYQYDGAVLAYLSIKEQFDAADWTLVSPIEEYPMVEAFGYHTNLWEFVRDMSPESDVSFGFPTGHVFFFVEMDPLYGGGRITREDAMKPFPGPVVGDLTKFYYRSDNRRILEAKLYNWVQWYMKEHPDKMSVYIDTDSFKVFHLEQEARTPAVPLPHLPKEAEGVW